MLDEPRASSQCVGTVCLWSCRREGPGVCVVLEELNPALADILGGDVGVPV